MKKQLILFLTLFLVLQSIFALGADWKFFDCYNSQLPQYGDHTVVIDSLGDKWISTDGLVKVENFNWTWYTKYNSGLPSNRLGSIAMEVR